MIKLITVGKIKEAYFRDAIAEYQKRIQKYGKVELIEVADASFDNPNLVLEKEKLNIEKYISPSDFIITLEIEGKQLDSVTFSDMIEKWQMQNGTICFIIGGSYGIHEEIKKRSNYSLSFSKMTFPHQLFRIILLEQIYRSYRILKNESYHK